MYTYRYIFIWQRLNTIRVYSYRSVVPASPSSTTYIYIYLYIHIYICIYIDKCIHIDIYLTDISEIKYKSMIILIDQQLLLRRLQLHIYLCICMCILIYIYIYICIYIYIYIYIFIHIDIYLIDISVPASPPPTTPLKRKEVPDFHIPPLNP
jgi:hypothetical protein